MEEQNKQLNKIESLLQENSSGLTILQITSRLRLNRNSISKYLSILESLGRVSMQHVGRAKLYSLSKRVPFDQLIQKISDGYLLLDEDLTICDANSIFCSLFELDKEKILSRKICDFSLFRNLSPLFMRTLLSSQTHRDIYEEIEYNEKNLFVSIIPTLVNYGELRTVILFRVNYDMP